MMKRKRSSVPVAVLVRTAGWALFTLAAGVLSKPVTAQSASTSLFPEAACVEYLSAPGSTQYIAHFGYLNTSATTFTPVSTFSPGSATGLKGATNFAPGYHRDAEEHMTSLSSQTTWTLGSNTATVSPAGFSPQTPTCKAALALPELFLSQTTTYSHAFLGDIIAAPADAATVYAFAGSSPVRVTNLSVVLNDATNPEGVPNPNSIYGDVTMLAGAATGTYPVRLELQTGAGFTRGVLLVNFTNPGGPATATTTTVTASGTNVAAGSTVQLRAQTAKVSSGALVSAGNVTFFDTLNHVTTTLGTASLSTQTASLSAALAGNGNHVVTAVFHPADLSMFGLSIGTAPTIAVVAPPTLAASFSPSTIVPNASSTLTFTLSNPSGNPAAMSSLGFTNTLPAGLTASAASTTCAGAAASLAGSTLSLAGANLAVGASCSVSINVTGSGFGSYSDTSSVLSGAGATGLAASATLQIEVTPTMLVFTTPPPATATAGSSAGNVAIALEDAGGNVAGDNSTAAVTLSVQGPANYTRTYTATAAGGVASFALPAVLRAAGSYQYTATAAGLAQASVTENVAAGAASSLSVSGLGSFIAPQVSGTATVTALDAFGNVATGYTGTVALSSTDSAAVFAPASYVYTAMDAGTKAFGVTLNTAGEQTVTATSGNISGSQFGVLVEEAIWVLSSDDSLLRLTDAGSFTNSAGNGGGNASAGSVAVDHAGNAWVATADTNSIVAYTRLGTNLLTGSAGAGVNAPVAVAVDGMGQVWMANRGSGSVSVLDNMGNAVTGAAGLQNGTLTAPSGIAIDPSGSVWIADAGSNSVVKIIGAGAPVVTPLATAAAGNALGTRP